MIIFLVTWTVMIALGMWFYHYENRDKQPESLTELPDMPLTEYELMVLRDPDILNL